MIIDLQGTLDFNGDVSSRTMGHLAWRKDGLASLIIGHQLMEGKIVQMERPFLVVNKSTITDAESSEGADSVVKSCNLVGVIRRKLVFKTRPRPIVTQLPVA